MGTKSSLAQFGPQGPQGPQGPIGPINGKKAWGFTSAPTDASGNVTVNLAPAAFSAPPAIAATPGPTTDANLVDWRITALTSTSVTFNVQRALAVTVLALQVLASKVPAPGIILQVVATEK